MASAVTERFARIVLTTACALATACGAAATRSDAGPGDQLAPAVDASTADGATSDAALDGASMDAAALVDDATTGPEAAAGDGAHEAHSGPGCGPGEVCGNGVDDDCDGLVDEDCACAVGSTQRCYVGPPLHAGVGACALGTQRCEGPDLGAWGACEGAAAAASEVCGNRVDDDCDGLVDEGCACATGETRACYTGAPGTAGVGRCAPGTQTCVATPEGGRLGPCEGQVVPEANRCDGVDRACTGDPYLGCECVPGATERCFSGPPWNRGAGECRDGARRCALGADMLPHWGACEGEVLPAGPNVCDGRDRACSRTPMCCVEGAARPCYPAPTATQGVGLCRAGLQRCTRGPDGRTSYGACEGAVMPAGPNGSDCVDRACTGVLPASCPACDPGSAPASCYDGPPATRGVGRCRAGTRACGGSPARPGACVGEVLPAAEELCGNGDDDDCDGAVDEGCACAGPSACFTGPARARNVGACRDGAYRCVTAAGASAYDRSVCAGQVLPGREVCGNGLDDDCDGVVDCGCFAIGPAVPWEIYRPAAPVCFGRTFAACGLPGEFDAFATDRIPARDDPAWRPWAEPRVDFGADPASPDRPTRLAPPCDARNGGDFTLFQTGFSVAESQLRPGFTGLLDFRIRARRVNNALRATIYNGRFPQGASVSALFAASERCDAAEASGETRLNLVDLIAPGFNRLVLTLLDDAGPARELSGVELVVDGAALAPCGASSSAARP